MGDGGKGDRQRVRDRQRTTKAWFDTEYDRIFNADRRRERADEVVDATKDETLEEQEE